MLVMRIRGRECKYLENRLNDSDTRRHGRIGGAAIDNPMWKPRGEGGGGKKESTKGKRPVKENKLK